MNCPDCGGDLITVGAKASDDKPLGLDYCSSCGGYFLDHWEANRVSYESLLSLSSSLPASSKKEILGGNGRCPHCFVPLIVLQHSSIPRHCLVKSCPQCKGNWFSQGELLKFKRAQRARVEYFKSWNIPISSVFQALIPILILVIISASIPVTVYLVQRRNEERILASELVRNISVIPFGSSGVIVAFSTTVSLPTEIEYGTSSFDLKKITVSITSSTFHQVKLESLERGVKYQYRLLLHKEGRVMTTEFRYFEAK